MSRVPRPIHLPGQAALGILREHVRAALHGWARDWVRGWSDEGQQLAELHVRTVDVAGLHDEYQSLHAEGGTIWLRRGRTDRAQLGSAVTGVELMPEGRCADDWIANVVDQAWDSRSRALCIALLGAPCGDPPVVSMRSPPADLFHLGSGAVQVTCPRLGLHAIADNQVWRRIPPTEHGRPHHRSGLQPLDKAARGASAKLEALLGSVEIDVRKLLELRCGDVLILPQRLDDEIAVLCAGKPLARGALGAIQGRTCVQLLARHE